MKLRLLHKLLTLVLIAGTVPLIIVSVLLIGLGRSQVESTVELVHSLEAHAAATRVREFLIRTEDRLRSDFEDSIDKLSDEEVQKYLIYVLQRQDNMLTFRVMGLLDAVGTPIGDPVWLPATSIPEEYHASYLVDENDVERFMDRLPVAAAIESREPQFSEVYASKKRKEAMIAMALPIVDEIGELRWVAYGEVSLREVQRMVSDVTLGTAGHACLVDADGRAIAHPRFDSVLRAASLTDNGIVSSALTAKSGSAVSYQRKDGEAILGAHAPVHWEGWQLVVQQPAADAYAQTTAMIKRASFVLCVALFVSILWALLYARSLVRPLREVVEGMGSVMDGNYDQQIPVRTRDEVGELAIAFNKMGRMLYKSRREIEGWNMALTQRVEAKTRALKDAQEQLIRSAKMSSLGQLGAGVAHEMNNPLTGIVGQTTLLGRRLKKLDIPKKERQKLESYIEHVQTESARCREIVHGLLSFSQTTSGEADDLDLNETLGKVMVLIDNNAQFAGVSVKQSFGRDLPHLRANGQQVQQAVMQLVTNSIQSMPEGGELEIITAREGENLTIEVKDEGRGIAPEHIDRVFEPFFTTKDVWGSTGLGLAVAYSVVEQHEGDISVESELGKGTSVTISLPIAGATMNIEKEGARIGKANELLGTKVTA